jgi:hypothetical protein
MNQFEKLSGEKGFFKLITENLDFNINNPNKVDGSHRLNSRKPSPLFDILVFIIFSF